MACTVNSQSLASRRSVIFASLPQASLRDAENPGSFFRALKRPLPSYSRYAANSAFSGDREKKGKEKSAPFERTAPVFTSRYFFFFFSDPDHSRACRTS